MPDKLVLAVGAAAALGTAYFLGPWRCSFKRQGALKGKTKPVELTLTSKSPLTHDTRLFTFAFPSADELSGLPVGNHIVLAGPDSTRRPYTPVSLPDTRGRFDFAIKVYQPTPEFPNGGKMSQYLDSLAVGAKIDAFGPFGMLEYEGPPGQFAIRKGFFTKKLTVKRLCLIAGGTGITPMFQIIQTLLVNGDRTKIDLIFANKTTDDIILKQRLDEFVKNYPEQFSVTYVITRQESGKTGVTGNLLFGKLDRKLMEDLLPKPSDDCLVAVCGRPKMVKEVCLPALKEIGFSSDHIFAF